MTEGSAPSDNHDLIEIGIRPRRTAPKATVQLIRPPITIFPKSLSQYGPVPPIGLAYLAAVLRDAGHDVSIIDATVEGMDHHEDFETGIGMLRHVGLPAEAVVDRIPADVDVVGISHMFLHEWPVVRDLAERIRKERPDALIVLGGENATAFRSWIFEETDVVDAIVLGEGEATLLEMVERFMAGVALSDLQGVAFRPGFELSDSAASVDNGLPVRMRKLDKVPWPAWDLVPLDKYWEYADFFGVNRGRYIPVMATRGCPYRCSFCSSPQMWTTRYIVRDPGDIADEIAHYVHEYGVQNVNFHDLTAITKRSWTLSFCDELEKRDLDLVWQLPVGTRCEALDREVLQRLWDTGCRNITYAPESGSERMLGVFDKKVNLPALRASLREAIDVGLRTRVNIIIGHPDERWSDTWQSLKFLFGVALDGCDDASVIMFCAYPGSVDFTNLIESGELEIDERAMYVGLSRTSKAHRSYNPRMSGKQLHLAQLAMLSIFYGVTLLRHPRRIIQHIKAIRSGQETTILEQLVRVKWRGYRRTARW